VTTAGTESQHEPHPAEPPQQPGSASDGVGHALRTVASITIVSRCTGLARDAVCSRIFGAGPIWSAFAFAFMLPNLFRRLFGEGALSAAFLPEYAKLTDKDEELARSYAGATIVLLVGVLGAATLLGELVLLGVLLSPLADIGGLALRLAMITLPFMPMVCATATMGAALQCHHRFGPPAAAPIIINLSIIAAATVWTVFLSASEQATIFAVAASVLVAGVVQIVWMLWSLKGRRPRWTAWLGPDRQRVAPLLKRTIKRMGPVAIGMSALQINTLIDGLIASWPILIGPTIALPFLAEPLKYPLDEASNAVLFFGQRLYHFPLGVFGIALATAAFPALARSTKVHADFVRTLRRSVRLSLFIGLPASIGLLLVREPLIAVIYQGGEFSASAGARVADVLLGYAPGIWAFGLTHILTRAFYAQGDTKTPMRVSLIAIAVNTILNFTLIWTLREAALAWSTTFAAIGQCVALVWLARRRWGADVLDRTLVKPVVIVVVNSALMGAAVIGVGAILPHSDSWTGSLLLLGALVLAGAGVFIAGSIVMRAPELRWLIEGKITDTKTDTDGAS